MVVKHVLVTSEGYMALEDINIGDPVVVYTDFLDAFCDMNDIPDIECP